jgi:hypothetical protein
MQAGAAIDQASVKPTNLQGGSNNSTPVTTTPVSSPSVSDGVIRNGMDEVVFDPNNPLYKA